MSIQSEIERISQAKTDIHSAIESKGVTVPDDTLISEMAPYIQQIREAGTVVTSVSNVGPDESGNAQLKNLKIYCGEQDITYNGGAEQTLTISPATVGAATAAHGTLAQTAVQPAQIADFITAEDIPSSLPNPQSLTIQLHGSSTTVYDGSITKTINITPSSIGAAPMDHATSTRVYGIGTNSSYGHVRLSDSITDTSSTSSGCAATPYAVKQVNDNMPVTHKVNLIVAGWNGNGTGDKYWRQNVGFDGITSSYEVVSITQATYESSDETIPDTEKKAAATWTYVETGPDRLSFYSKEKPTDHFSLIVTCKYLD